MSLHVESIPHPVAQVLREGVPLSLTRSAAAAFARRCQVALEQLGPGETPAAVKLRAAQLIVPSALRSAQCDLGTAAEAAAALLRTADRVGDDEARAYASAAWAFTHPGPEHITRRVRLAQEVLDVAADQGVAELVPVGYALLLNGLLEQGEIRSLDVHLLEETCATHSWPANSPDNPAVWFRCLRHILDGDTDGAERLAVHLLKNSPEKGTTARALYTTQLGMIRWMQGRSDGVEEIFLAARREYPEQLLWAASLAWLWIAQGRRASAEAVLTSLPPVDEIPRDRFWLSTVTVLAEVARSTGTRQNAQRLRDLLLPYAEHLVPVGVGVSFWGTVARTLGLLEERLGLWAEARTHLELAVATSARIGALAWHAEAQIELAEFGLRHHVATIPAYELLEEARATAVARDFPALAARARARPRIRVLGRFEVVSLCGRRAEWTSRKARELLKMLVAAQGVPTSREVFMDVLWPGEAPAALANRFSVAVNVIRRALDPQRRRPTQHHLVTEGDSVRLATDRLDIDLDRFLALAGKPDAASRSAATKLYRGPAFSEEPYADWATEVRDHADLVYRHLIGAGVN